MLIFRYQPSTCDSPACNNNPNICPGYQVCEPMPPSFFDQSNFVFVVIYTIEYTMRFFTAWAVPPDLNFVTRYNAKNGHMLDKINIVDLIGNSSNKECCVNQNLVPQNADISLNNNKIDSSMKILPNNRNRSDCIIKTFQLEPFEENPEFNKIEFYIRYILSIRSIIDLLCFLPLWIYLADNSSLYSTYHALCVVRVVRIFKLLLSIKSFR